MKLAIGEWDQFWKEIGEDWYMDDSTFPEETPTAGMMEGDAALCWQGSGSPEDGNHPLFTTTEKQDRVAIFSTVFRRWKKKQNQIAHTVEIPKEEEEAFQATIKKHGWKVLS